MAQKTLEDIEKELTSLDQNYEEGYSGKDRHTVDPAGPPPTTITSTSTSCLLREYTFRSPS